MIFQTMSNKQKITRFAVDIKIVNSNRKLTQTLFHDLCILSKWFACIGRQLSEKLSRLDVNAPKKL